MLTNKYQEIIKIAVLCLAVSLFSFILGAKIASKTSYIIINSDNTAKTENISSEQIPLDNDMDEDINKDIDKDLRVISKVKEAIQEYYVDEPDTSKLVEGALKGMVQALDDPYSVFMNYDEYEDFMISLEGSFDGVGIVITSDEDTGDIVVSSAIEGSPAQKAGILVGDKILQVDDIPLEGKTVNEVADIIRGPEGTKVTLHIERPGNSSILKFELIRQNITIKTVSWEMLDDTTAYIKIMSFDVSTSENFSEALSAIEEHGAKALILDLRNNPGGSLYESVKVADTLLGQGLVVYTEDRYKNKIEEYYYDEAKISIPLVVLINENSASASEIVAGAIQSYKAGTLVGTKSFGKGSVQELKPFGDLGALKMTIAKYYLPNGRSIDGVGIEPDIEVGLPQGVNLYNIPRSKDTQLIKAREVAAKMENGV